MTVNKIVKTAAKAAGKVAENVSGTKVAEKTGKAVYNKRGTLALVFGALAAAALGYWATKVRGKK